MAAKKYLVNISFFIEAPGKASALEVADDISDSVYKEYEFDSNILEVVEID